MSSYCYSYLEICYYLLCIYKCPNSGVAWDFQKLTEQHTCGILGTSTSNGGVVVCLGVHCS